MTYSQTTYLTCDVCEETEEVKTDKDLSKWQCLTPAIMQPNQQVTARHICGECSEKTEAFWQSGRVLQ